MIDWTHCAGLWLLFNLAIAGAALVHYLRSDRQGDLTPRDDLDASENHNKGEPDRCP